MATLYIVALKKLVKLYFRSRAISQPLQGSKITYQSVIIQIYFVE